MARVSEEDQGPAHAERAALLYNSWWLDVPKLMDIAALYGQPNQDLCRTFMRKVLDCFLPPNRLDMSLSAPTRLCQSSEPWALLRANILPQIGIAGHALTC